MAQFVEHNQSLELNSTTSVIILDQDKTVQKFESLYYSAQPVISSILIGTGLLGICGNLLTLVVFFRLGFLSTVNVSCAALTVSDLCCVVAGILCGISVNGVFRRHFDERSFYHFSNLAGGLVQITFSRITALITAWISLERCLCVVFPAKIRMIVTRRLTAVVLTAIFSINFLFMVSIYVAFRFDIQVDPQTNSTVWTLYWEKESTADALREIALLLFGMIFPVFSWLVVAICTAILTFKLKQSSKWRRQNAQSPVVWHTNTANIHRTRKQGLAEKERRLTKVVVLVAAIFLACSVPTSAQLLARLTLPEYGIGGNLSYLYLVNGSICVLMNQLNSSINIFVYASLGQNFRAALRQVLC
ncbi:chemosensory receptor A [Elysia marginata]|uniref:Chemosensory receptor A n=1 Tax=Elysia marginata TaxID=1093978 RepID=A0AAV4I0W6_9GAST|nr:chemosensory receptor A [Elysia marginata]